MEINKTCVGVHSSIPDSSSVKGDIREDNSRQTPGLSELRLLHGKQRDLASDSELWLCTGWRSVARCLQILNATLVCDTEGLRETHTAGEHNHKHNYNYSRESGRVLRKSSFADSKRISGSARKNLYIPCAKPASKDQQQAGKQQQALHQD